MCKGSTMEMIAKQAFSFCLMIFCIVCKAQIMENTTPDSERTLYPYLGANNQYGYADAKGKVVIEPQYTSVNFFYNGLAVVRINGGQEQIINTHNEVVPLPVHYDEVRIHAVAHYAFVETTEYYDNRWRFWEWRFLPGFSIIGGGSSDSRLFDTKVAREKRTLYWWEAGELMATKRGRRSAGETYYFLRDVGGGVVQIDDELYELEGSKVKRLARNIEPYKMVDGNLLMRKTNRGYRIVDNRNNDVLKRTFKPRSEQVLDVADSTFVMKTENMGIRRKPIEWYVDNENQVFVYPDFSKPFPTRIHANTWSEDASSLGILTKTQQIASIPHTDRFLMVLNFGKTVHALDTTGVWHDPETHYDDIRVLSAGVSSIIWPPYRYFVGDPPLPEGAEIQRVQEFGRDTKVFQVTITNGEKRRIGVWDSGLSEWLMEPIYAQIHMYRIQPRFLSFQSVEDEKWGFYDLSERSIHIPPIYDSVQGNGWVRMEAESNQQFFYLDITTKLEFRAPQ